MFSLEYNKQAVSSIYIRHNYKDEWIYDVWKMEIIVISFSIDSKKNH
jgi:hypothetical protein